MLSYPPSKLLQHEQQDDRPDHADDEAPFEK